MHFAIAQLRGSECGAKCPRVIVADGVIEPDTPDVFLAFARSAAEQSGLRGVVFLNSPGGNVVASMELGNLFRRLRIAAVVASFGNMGAYSGPVSGECASACVYAMMGAVKRVAPSTSRVALHRMSLPAGQDHMPLAGQPRFADPHLVGVVAKYAQRMGVNPVVVRLAESLQPGTVYEMSQSQMSAWRLATSRF